MPPHEPTPDDALQVPKRTTPTWEMEMLLSGATVFALFQAAQATQAGGMYLMPRLDGAMLQFTSVMFTYLQGAIILLVLTFGLHLVMRAYWVALVGMNSVFPGDINPEKTRAGPIAKALLRRRWRSMDSGIELADNRATMVFGLGVAVAVVIAPVSVFVCLLFGVSMVIAWLLGWPDSTMQVYAVLGLVLFLPYAAAALLDSRRGEKLREGTTMHRVVSALLSGYARLGMGRDAFPLLALFQNNIGERRGNAIVIAIMFSVTAASMLALVIGRNDLGLGSYGDFPEPRRGMAAAANGRHYLSLQEPGASPETPYLPDLVARGPYLRLVVPFMPMRHGFLLERCDPGEADKDRVEPERARREQLLACVAKDIDVRLDGAPVSALPEWYTDPARDVRGLLYMIPAQDLAAGRHELSVLPSQEEPPGEDEDPPQPYLIPFWR